MVFDLALTIGFPLITSFFSTCTTTLRKKHDSSRTAPNPKIAQIAENPPNPPPPKVPKESHSRSSRSADEKINSLLLRPGAPGLAYAPKSQCGCRAWQTDLRSKEPWPGSQWHSKEAPSPPTCGTVLEAVESR